MRFALLFTFCLVFTGLVAQAQTQRDDMEVVAEGRAAFTGDLAAAEEEAVWDAKRNAVEQAAGVFLRARTEGRNFDLLVDEVQSRTEGFIRRWQVIKGTRHVERSGQGDVLSLKVRATVALLPVIRRLSDIADVYEDMERPRLRIEVEGDEPRNSVRSAMTSELKVQGFDIADAGKAEVAAVSRLEIVPTVRLGDTTTPYGIGEVVAACRVRLSVRFTSLVSEEVLFAAFSEASGTSFQSDEEARIEAAIESVRRLFHDQSDLFAHQLLVRWARERQEGHVVSVQVTGLDFQERAALCRELGSMRGFLRFTDRMLTGKRYVVRFLTRQDTRSIRRRLAGLCVGLVTLIVLDNRGPLINCAVRNHTHLTRR